MAHQLFWPVIILLIFLGIVVLEVFLPTGGLLGVLATIAFVSSVVIAFINGGLFVGTLFLVFAAVVLGFVLWLTVRIWPHTPIGKLIIVQPRSSDEVIPPEYERLKQLIGRQGVATSTMLPSGSVRIDGRSLDAISDGRPIESGQRIKVVAVKGRAVVVRACDVNEPDEPPKQNDLGQAETSEVLEELIPDPFDSSSDT
ncbi:MAG: hypothetical protein KDA87_03365 [Planctomycetales bacterium]|nr:hypothetical protein [Planctomycetales bacterium]